MKCPNIDFFVDRSLIREVGRPGRTRTCYHRLRRPVLYPDELRAHSFHSIAAGLGLVKAFATPEVSSAHHPPMSKFSSPLRPLFSGTWGRWCCDPIAANR